VLEKSSVSAHKTPSAVIVVNEEATQTLKHVRRRPAWMKYYKVTGIEYPITPFALFSDCDPTSFESAVQEEKLRKAMDHEMNSIEQNDTLELSDLLNGQKTIGVKWVFKTKLKENGEVGKYKERLVANGYK